MFLRGFIYGVLFFFLVPGVVIRIPEQASTEVQAIVHALVFAALSYLIFPYLVRSLERFDNPSTKINPKCPTGYKQCPSGDCVLISDVHAGCP